MTLYNKLTYAYRKMAMKYHPDRNKDINTTDKFQKIKEAFDVLSAEIKHNEKFNLFDIACNNKHIYNELNYRKNLIDYQKKQKFGNQFFESRKIYRIFNKK